MKAEWEAIWRNKQTLLDKARQANENYVLAIYEGISKGKDLRSLIRQVRSIKSLNLKMGLPDIPETERYAISVAKRIKKATPQAVLDLKSHEALGIYCLKQLQRFGALEGLSKLAYKRANQAEAEAKQGLLNKLIDNEDPVASKGAKGDEPLSMLARIFYLCSWHGDCAQDHQDWQGKLYYDRFWRRHVKDKPTQERVLDFIQINGMMSLQWATNKPVWLITRPNCRHYFEQVTIKEVLGKSTDELLDERGMKRRYGERGTNQTIRHSTQEGWYTRENVLNIIQKYKERLALHQRMYELQPSQTLEGYIEKDKRLIKKWRYMLGKI